METLFENTFTASIEIVSEINQKVWDPKRKPMGGCFLVAAFLIGLFAQTDGKGIWWYIALACGAYGVYNLFYHRIWAYDLIRKTKKDNDGKIPSATVTVSDKFIWQYLSTTMSFSFSDLKAAYFLKHSIRLISIDNAYMTFQRNGFVKGNAEELEKFLRTNCPQAQIIYKE